MNDRNISIDTDRIRTTNGATETAAPKTASAEAAAPETAAIAMSGGVDSAVAALLLREQGYNCFGATMKLCKHSESEREAQAERDIADARATAEAVGIRHITVDLSEQFEKTVISDFISAYEHGETPSPCVLCNRVIKFGALLEQMLGLGADKLATGHYARIERSGDRYLLRRATDRSKDQSYMLCLLDQHRLSHILFPLGELTKAHVRELAANAGLSVSQRGDSQDICFVPSGRYTDFIAARTGKTYPAGDFISPDGGTVGRHRGIIGYTVGQRRGLGLALPEPLYVGRISPEENRVYLTRGDGLYSRELDADRINFIPFDTLDRPIRVTAKLRYRHAEQTATVTPTGDGTVHVCFDEPQRAITPGQAVVFYDGDYVIGGGIITRF